MHIVYGIWERSFLVPGGICKFLWLSCRAVGLIGFANTDARQVPDPRYSGRCSWRTVEGLIYIGLD